MFLAMIQVKNAPAVAYQECVPAWCPVHSAQLTDLYGNPTVTASALPITVTSTQAQATAFYSDAQCQNAISGFNVAAGQGTSTGFYFKSSFLGSLGSSGNDHCCRNHGWSGECEHNRASTHYFDAHHLE